MELHLVRHAIAAERSDPAMDHARPLTPEGRRRFERGVAGLERLGVRLDRVLCSPWTRAVQTADLLGPIVDGPRELAPELAGAPGPPLLARIAEAPAGVRVALVGHEPWLGELGAWLAFGDPALGSGIRMKKGGVLILAGDPRPGGCEIVAQLPPRLLRRCGGRLN